LGPPPLLEGEDPDAYDRLLAGIRGCVTASDFIEEIWINEIVRHTWEIIRWARLKTALHNEGMTDAMTKLLVRPLGLSEELEHSTVFTSNEAKTLARSWAAKNSSDVKRVCELLASIGRTMDTVQGQALELKLDTIERIDRLIMSAEMRRSAVFAEIDRHRNRKQFAANLRSKVAAIEDAQFETLTTTPPPSTQSRM
jgi:hypothetical protein